MSTPNINAPIKKKKSIRIHTRNINDNIFNKKVKSKNNIHQNINEINIDDNNLFIFNY